MDATVKLATVLLIGSVVAERKPEVMALLGARIDEVDWRPDYVGWPNYYGLFKSIMLTNSGSKWVKSPSERL